jgi:hypothetical protein
MPVAAVSQAPSAVGWWWWFGRLTGAVGVGVITVAADGAARGGRGVVDLGEPPGVVVTVRLLGDGTGLGHYLPMDALRDWSTARAASSHAGSLAA